MVRFLSATLFGLILTLALPAGVALADDATIVPDAAPATGEDVPSPGDTGNADGLQSDGFANSGERCACESRSPAKLLETQQDLEVPAEGGSAPGS